MRSAWECTEIIAAHCVKLLFVRPREVSCGVLLPIAELAVWSAVVLIPMLFMYARPGAVLEYRNATIHSRQWMLPRDRRLMFPLAAIGERRFHLITDLNLPGLIVGAPLSVPVVSFLRRHPAALSTRAWHTITVPFFCLPAWWFVGIGLDGLLARRRLHWAPLVMGSILSCACVAFVAGILTSPPADRPDLLGLLPGAIFWTFAFGVLPLNWLVPKRCVETVVPGTPAQPTHSGDERG